MGGMRLVEHPNWPYNVWGWFLVSGYLISMYLIQKFVKAALQITLKVEGSDVRDCFVENALMDHGVFLSLVKCSMHA